MQHTYSLATTSKERVEIFFETLPYDSVLVESLFTWLSLGSCKIIDVNASGCLARTQIFTTHEGCPHADGVSEFSIKAIRVQVSKHATLIGKEPCCRSLLDYGSRWSLGRGHRKEGERAR